MSAGQYYQVPSSPQDIQAAYPYAAGFVPDPKNNIPSPSKAQTMLSQMALKAPAQKLFTTLIEKKPSLSGDMIFELSELCKGRGAEGYHQNNDALNDYLTQIKNIHVRKLAADYVFNKAITMRGVDKVAIAIHYGADVNRKGVYGRFYDQPTALHAICSSNSNDLDYSAYARQLIIAHLLLASGADPNRKDKEGRTPLHLICNGIYAYHNSGNFCRSMTALLLSWGADINTQDKGKRNVLHYVHDTVPLAKLLLANGADPAVASRDGTPCDIAERRRHKVVIGNSNAVSTGGDAVFKLYKVAQKAKRVDAAREPGKRRVTLYDENGIVVAAPFLWREEERNAAAEILANPAYNQPIDIITGVPKNVVAIEKAADVAQATAVQKELNENSVDTALARLDGGEAPQGGESPAAAILQQGQRSPGQVSSTKRIYGVKDR